ncbi:MAG: twin-arginine translocase subunit TatC [Candidatus Eremiobacteraeota bacterium]|nr:twin-arginine translocase subunit TatC [Candidatus Eremiobacteraeota bacterium]MCL5055203.1 twin-arginine translocase subunit TatC [Bacillota bacterium]
MKRIFKPENKTMSFVDHLDEMRTRLIYSIIVVFAFTILGFSLSGKILDFMIKPVPELVFISPAEAFLMHLKIGLIAGVVLSSPFLFYQLLMFLLPALKIEERKSLIWILPLAFFFFVGGASFVNFLLLPVAMKFFLSYSTSKIHEMISLSNYVNFVLSFWIAGGIAFELPLVMMGLGKIGIIKSQLLRKYRKEAFLAILIITAILSPSPDLFSWGLLSGCMYALFELSIYFVKIVEKG